MAIRAQVPSISEIVSITEDNDPNDLIGRPDGYVAAAILRDPRSDDEFSECIGGGLGVDCGATIEQWPSDAAAEKRKAQIQAAIAADPILPSEYGYVQDAILLRVSGYLKPSEAAEYEAAFNGETPSLASNATPDPVEETKTTEPTPLPVSMSTTCQLLFPGTRRQAELDKINDFIVGTIKPTPRTFRQFKGNVAEVADVATFAPEALARYLDGLVVSLDAYIDDLEATGGATLDTTAYKAAGLEIATICSNHL